MLNKRRTPYAHQIEGTNAILAKKTFALFDEMGAGKSKQTIDAACTLCENGKLNVVVVVCPASVKSVWMNSETHDAPGEIAKHAWIPSRVSEFHTFKEQTGFNVVWSNANPQMDWIITNYEYLRDPTIIESLGKMIPRDSMIVADESSFIANRNAQQSEQLNVLRKYFGYAVILNGTPTTKDPLDLWNQFMFLNPNIMGRRWKNFYHFRNTYAVMGGWNNKKVIKWHDLDQLSKFLAPWVLRRLKKDCLDLPEKIFTQREVSLSDKTWARYKDMRDEAILFLEQEPQGVVASPQAGVVLLRLAQITSGHIGGVDVGEPLKKTVDLSDEKISWMADEIKKEIEWDESFRCIVWTRFRREREVLAAKLTQELRAPVFQIFGSQPHASRQAAITYFSEPGKHGGVLLAQPQAGGWGLNLVGSHHAYYLSSDFSLRNRLQSEDRQHRPGQHFNCLYCDVMATGPKGQQTVDHIVMKARRKKIELSELTARDWVRMLKDQT